MTEAHLRLIFAVIVCGIVGAAPVDQAASTAGQKWIALLDDQKFAESWNQAGSRFRNQVSQEQWVNALRRSREPLGPVISRTPSRVEFGSKPNDATINFTTNFKNHGVLTERLTLVSEDGRWQVAAYAIMTTAPPTFNKDSGADSI